MIEQHLEKLVLNEKRLLDKGQLLNLNRFDLGFKLALLREFDNGNWNKSIALDAYLEHINILTNGQFQELSNSKKRGKESYLNEFINNYISIKENGFDASLGSIPINENGCLINGAHRVSILSHLNLNIPTTLVDHNDLLYNYSFFKAAGMKETYIDIAALNMIETFENLHVACIWPISGEKIIDIEEIVKNQVIYKKKIKFTEIGKKNLLLHLYPSESWIGNLNNNYKGIYNKAKPCFGDDSNNEVTFYVLKEHSLEAILKLKDDIRKIVNVGKHALHITDTKEENKLLARSIFTEDGRKLINDFAFWEDKNKWSRFSSDDVFNNTKEIYRLNENEMIQLSQDYNISDLRFFHNYPFLSQSVLQQSNIILKNNMMINDDSFFIKMQRFFGRIRMKTSWEVRFFLKKIGLFNTIYKIYKVFK